MICSNCGKEIAEGTAFCTQCGTPVAAMPQGQAQPQGQPQFQNQANYGQQQFQNQPNYGQPMPAYDPTDHTAEFNPKDVSDNKVIAMLPYLMGTIGVLIAIIAAKESPFVSFHVREALKIAVCEILLAIIMLVLCWTIIVPIAACVCFVIILVLRIICFVRICKGQAKEVPIIKGLGFLK